MDKPEINELTATVKAIKVNSKKMPIVMFRQLPIYAGHFFTEDGNLKPEITVWGHVLYEREEGNRWLVITLDGRLKLAKFPEITSVKAVESDIENYHASMQTKAAEPVQKLALSDVECGTSLFTRPKMVNQDEDGEGYPADYSAKFEARLNYAKNQEAADTALRNSHQLFIGV